MPQNRTEFYAELALSDPEWVNTFPDGVVTVTAVRKRTVHLAYKRFLDRVPEDKELQTWVESDLTEIELYKTIKQSEEAQSRRDDE